MKLREIFRFELACQLRSFQTWLFFAVLGVVAFTSIEANFLAGARNGEYLPCGERLVALDARARKVVVDEAGVETEVPMNDWVEVGVFASAETGLFFAFDFATISP